MKPDEWRRLVGQHLEHRRRERGYSSRYQICEGVDLSESWVRQMESGEVKRNDGEVVAPNPRGNKVRILMDQLAWPADAVDRMLDGTSPAELPTVDAMSEGEKLDQVTETLTVLVDEIRLLRADLAMRMDRNVEN